MNKYLNTLHRLAVRLPVLLLLIISFNSYSQEFSDEKIKTAITFQFAQNIVWPNESQLDTFRIMVLTDNLDLISEFKEISKAKKIKDRTISIYRIGQNTKFRSIKTNILYIDRKYNEILTQIFTNLYQKPVLIITENFNLDEYKMINFIYLDSEKRKISYEVNKNSIEQDHNLSILPKLLLLGGSRLDVANLYQKQEEKLKDVQEKSEKQRVILESQNNEIEKQKLDIQSQSNDIKRQQNEIDLQKRNLDTLFNEIRRQQHEVNNNLAVINTNRIEIVKQQKTITSQVQEMNQWNQILAQQKEEIQNQKDKIKNQVESLSSKEKKIQTQNNLLIFSISSIVLAVCLIFFILIGYFSKKKTNKKLEEKNIAIEKQEQEIQLQALQIEATNKELELQNHYLEETVRVRTEEYRIAKEKAEEADKLKSAFLANMSHEIRTPLNAIVGFSQILSKQEDISDEIKSYFDIILESSHDLLRLINDIIDIAKIESGQIQFNMTDYDLYSELESISHLFSEQLGLDSNKEKVEIEFSPDYSYQNLIVKVDPYRLKQIINNLLSNAAKFTHVGSIEFGYKVKDQIIEFFVKDTGIGIPAEFHGNLFQRFVKIDQSDQRLYSGTGLGLVISKNLVEMHGGKIWFDSTPNVGTQFYFTIPLIPGELTKEKIINVVNKVSFNNKTVLICEDDENSRDLLGLLLKKMNINTISSSDGIEAIELFKKNPNIDLVLLDIQMPRLNGYKTLTELRKLSVKRIPIIAQSAFAMTHEIEKIMDSGFDDYISKPIIQEELENILSKRM